MMRDAGSLAYAENKMHELIDGAWKEVEDNLPNTLHRKYIHDLAYFSIKRKV